MTSPRPAPRHLPPVGFSLAIGAAMLAACWPIVALDMTVWLVPWFDHIVAAGPIGAFAAPFSNYMPPYLYLLAAASPLHHAIAAMTVIKLVSVLGTVALGLAAWRLLRAMAAREPARGAALVVALPSVAINAGWMGQCDALWAAACVLGVAMAQERRHGAMLMWCGVAIGFKAQAILAAPFFVAVLLSHRVPVRLWPIAPLTTAALLAPAWLLGWPAGYLVTLYLHQADTFHGLSMNAPNVWAIIGMLPAFVDLPLTAIAAIAAAIASIVYVAWFGRRALEGRTLLAAALLAPLVTAGLLPRMHERYFFLADVLALALAVTCRDRDTLRIALLVEGGSFAALYAFASESIAPAAIGGVAMILATDHVVRLCRATDRPARPRTQRLAQAERRS